MKKIFRQEFDDLKSDVKDFKKVFDRINIIVTLIKVYYWNKVYKK